MKTITLEEIYANPQLLGPLIEAGEPALITHGANSVRLTPQLVTRMEPTFVPFDEARHRAWFRATHGIDPSEGTRSVEEILDRDGDERSFFGR